MENLGYITDTGYSNYYSPPIKKKIGLILDVDNNILEQLIRFDNPKSFLLNFFTDLNADVITLIRGNKNIPYYQLDNFLNSSRESLYDYKSNNSLFFDSIKNALSFFGGKQSLSEIMINENLFQKMIKKNSIFKLISSNTICEDIYSLQNFITQNFSSFNQKLFDAFGKLNLSSIYSALNKVFEVFNNYRNKSKLKYIVIISDGNLKENDSQIQKLINTAKKNNITIISILLSKKKKENKIYSEFPKHLNKKIKNLFDVTSKVDYKNPFARHFINKNWDFPKEGLGTLLFEAKIEDLSNQYFTDNIKNISNEFYEIKIEDLNLDSILRFKFKFQTKNQIFGTCWANAYAAAITLANKRIFGRKIETFETYRENIIKYACKKYIDGGRIDEKTEKYFNKQRLRIEKITEQQVQSAKMHGKFIVCHFYLTEAHWDKFEEFYEKHKKEVLTEEYINNKLDPTKNKVSGHAVLLVDYQKDYLKFLNSWGSNFGDNGTFKVKNGNVLSPIPFFPIEFYDIYYKDEDLTKEEKKYYSKNIDYIAEILEHFEGISIEKFIKYYNDLSNEEFLCRICGSKIKINRIKTSIENGLHVVECQVCNYTSEPEGKFRELLILKNLLHDGNEDFDINYEEKDNLYIERIPLHENFFKNKSDECTLGLVNNKKGKIDSLFDKKINSIIWIEDNIFMAGGSEEIVVFKIDNDNFQCLMEKSFKNDDLLTLCNLQCDGLIATGGMNLKILKINYSIYFLSIEKIFEDENKINKIILIEKNFGEITKLLAFCDQNGNIGIYNIYKGEVFLSFRKRCHKSNINCILYIPEEDILVSVSNGDKKLIFWEIKKNNLKNINEKEIDSVVSNDCLLDIKGKLMVGQKDGIYIFEHENKNIVKNYFFENNGFGGVFSMKHIENEYFICGREFGFCSIFKARDSLIRKVNIFRNNNLMSSEDINIDEDEDSYAPFDFSLNIERRYSPKKIYINHININDDINYGINNDINGDLNNDLNFDNDNYYITNICCAKINENKGYILTSSADKTIKAYIYKILSNK